MFKQSGSIWNFLRQGRKSIRSGLHNRNIPPVSGRLASTFVALSAILSMSTATFAQKPEAAVIQNGKAAVIKAYSGAGNTPPDSGKPLGRADKKVDAIAGISDGKIANESCLYILAVGINEYKNPRYTLKYGRPDAEAFVQAVEEHGKKIFSRIVKQTVYDTQATRENVESTFRKIIAEARPQDVFVFYYAGHGVMSKGGLFRKPEFYMALTDVTKLYGDDELLERRGFSAEMLRDSIMKIKAQKQLVVLDTCHAGGALESFAVHEGPGGKTISKLEGNTGITVLAASGATQSATEFRQLGHGVFTYALIRGLAGEADNGSCPDGRITVKELETYLNGKVPELIRQYGGKAQNPNSFARGRDFSLGIK